MLKIVPAQGHGLPSIPLLRRASQNETEVKSSFFCRDGVISPEMFFRFGIFCLSLHMVVLPLAVWEQALMAVGNR